MRSAARWNGEGTQTSIQESHTFLCITDMEGARKEKDRMFTNTFHGHPDRARGSGWAPKEVTFELSYEDISTGPYSKCYKNSLSLPASSLNPLLQEPAFPKLPGTFQQPKVADSSDDTLWAFRG